ncbi:hypothetical protein [Candidatus Poriferisodalis sp.]|uniref:hypothetical protein n=1 Tax=Candidatus Poriferisodalis sp. TaxID=3101277 RepID=UPI003B527C43
MAILRRRRPLDLRPAAEWHEKFVREHPNAEELLAEAAEYFEQREAEYERDLEQRAEADSALLEERARKAISTAAKQTVGTGTCGAPTKNGTQCTNLVAPGAKKCSAGHRPRR